MCRFLESSLHTHKIYTQNLFHGQRVQACSHAAIHACIRAKAGIYDPLSANVIGRFSVQTWNNKQIFGFDVAVDQARAM